MLEYLFRWESEQKIIFFQKKKWQKKKKLNRYIYDAHILLGETNPFSKSNCFESFESMKSGDNSLNYGKWKSVARDFQDKENFIIWMEWNGSENQSDVKRLSFTLSFSPSSFDEKLCCSKCSKRFSYCKISMLFKKMKCRYIVLKNSIRVILWVRINALQTHSLN